MMHYLPTSSQHAVGSRCLAWGNLFSDRFVAGLPLCLATSWDGTQADRGERACDHHRRPGCALGYMSYTSAAAFSCVTYKLGGHFNPPFCKVPFPPFVK